MRVTQHFSKRFLWSFDWEYHYTSNKLYCKNVRRIAKMEIYWLKDLWTRFFAIPVSWSTLNNCWWKQRVLTYTGILVDNSIPIPTSLCFDTANFIVKYIINNTAGSYSWPLPSPSPSPCSCVEIWDFWLWGFAVLIVRSIWEGGFLVCLNF